MSNILCGNCGGKIKLPAGFAKAKIRCGACGYYAAVPPEMRSAAPAEDEAPAPPPKKKQARPAPPPPPPPTDDTPPERDRPQRTVVTPVEDPGSPEPTVKPARARARTNPRDTRPEFVPEDGAATPYLEGTQDEDDDRPYGVEGDGLIRCPECQGELPSDAAFCVHCGTHLDDGRKARPKKKRTYTEIDREFGEGFPLPTRLALMGVVLLLNVVLTVAAVVAVAEDKKVDKAGIATGGVVFLINSGLQAFIIGSYSTLRVQRNERGKGTLTVTRRFCFLPTSPVTVEWKSLVGVGRLATHSGGIIDWVTCVYLLVAAGCLPGILFWWFALKPERYHVVLCNLYGGVEETLFRGKNQQQAEEIADVVAEATGLESRGTV